MPHDYAHFSCLAIGASHIDTVNDRLYESPLTVAIKTEVIRIVNARVADPVTQVEDRTLVAVLHLLISEAMYGNERTVLVHKLGADRIVRQRGGLRSLSSKIEMAIMITS